MEEGCLPQPQHAWQEAAVRGWDGGGVEGRQASGHGRSTRRRRQLQRHAPENTAAPAWLFQVSALLLAPPMTTSSMEVKAGPLAGRPPEKSITGKSGAPDAAAAAAPASPSTESSAGARGAGRAGQGRGVRGRPAGAAALAGR